MEKKYFKELKKFYEEQLEETMNFWFDNGYDSKNGGFYVCLEEDGSVFGTDKSVWAQGRGLWIFAHAYNNIQKRFEWLEAAEAAYKFITENCFDKDGRMFFTVTETGEAIQKRRYWFSESFACVGSIELYKANYNPECLITARKCYDSIWNLYSHPELTVPKFNPQVVNCKALASPMILLVTSQIMRDIDKENSRQKIYEEVINKCLQEILHDHMHPEKKAVFENVSPDGHLVEGPRGRLVNPGHSIEASWFIMSEAERRNDQELLKHGLNILNWSFDIGWDKENKGLMYFADIEGKPCEQLEWDMKLWWPHNEMLIAFMMAYRLTKDEQYLEKYKMVHDYAFKHFHDTKHGEWYGYLHRDGTVSNTLKGNIFKGPFHLPRCLIENTLQINKILEGK